MVAKEWNVARSARACSLDRYCMFSGSMLGTGTLAP